MGHLNGILARVGGNLNNNFQKSQIPGGLPGSGGGGGDFEASIWPIHNPYQAMESVHEATLLRLILLVLQ